VASSTAEHSSNSIISCGAKMLCNTALQCSWANKANQPSIQQAPVVLPLGIKGLEQNGNYNDIRKFA
jgi:hypothetical protein